MEIPPSEMKPMSQKVPSRATPKSPRPLLTGSVQMNEYCVSTGIISGSDGWGSQLAHVEPGSVATTRLTGPASAPTVGENAIPESDGPASGLPASTGATAPASGAAPAS